MTMYYGRNCNRCGTPLNTNFPHIHKCDACRIVEATEQAAIDAKWQAENRNALPYTPDLNYVTVPSSFYEQEGFWIFLIFGSILLWVMWPFLSMFYRFFTG